MPVRVRGGEPVNEMAAKALVGVARLHGDSLTTDALFDGRFPLENGQGTARRVTVLPPQPSP